jgi:hypothetical protein
MQTTITGKMGEKILSLRSEFMRIRYEIHPERMMIRALPTNMRIAPMPEMIENRAAFLTIRKKVLRAAGQKDLLVSAI